MQGQKEFQGCSRKINVIRKSSEKKESHLRKLVHTDGSFFFLGLCP